MGMGMGEGGWLRDGRGWWMPGCGHTRGGVGWSRSVAPIAIRRAGCCPRAMGVSGYDRVATTTDLSFLSFDLVIDGVGELVGELAARWQRAGGGSVWWRWSWSWVPRYGRSQVVVMGQLWAQLVEWVAARVGGGVVGWARDERMWRAG